MGKRELLLIAAFLAIGFGAWRVTAPASTGGGTGFSVGRIVEHVRLAMRGERTSAPVRATTAATPGAAVTTVLVDEFNGSLTIVGEDRPDVAVELRGSVFGADETAARERLAKLALRLVEAGDTVRVSLTLPETQQRRPSLDLRLAVPARLGVKVARGRGDVEVRGLAAADLETRSGDLSVSDVAGLVRAEHRGGQVEVTRVGEVRCKVRMGDLRVVEVRGALECETEGGRVDARAVRGAVRIESQRTDLDLDGFGGPVTLDAEDGRVVLRDLKTPLVFTGDRGRLLLTLAAPVEVKVTAEDAPVEVVFSPGVGASADLETEDAVLRLPEPLQATSAPGNRQTFTGALGGGGQTLRVRSRRGDVTVRE
jgi:hypothetical protein